MRAAAAKKWEIAEVKKWLDGIYAKCGPCMRARRAVHTPQKAGITSWARMPSE